MQIPTVVWYSTPATVKRKIFSILAAVEVSLSAAGFAALTYYLGLRYYFIFVIIISPLLLLRSPESIDLGLRLFRKYVATSIAEFISAPERAFHSTRFWLSVVIAAFAGAASCYLLSMFIVPILLDVRGSLIPPILVSVLATNIALAAVVATSAREVVIVARMRTPAIVVTVALSAAIGIGTAFANTDIKVIALSTLCTVLLASFAILRVPKVINDAFNDTNKAARVSQGEGLTVARSIMDASPRSFLVFLPGFLFGFFVRCFCIRARATLSHLKAGVAALPDNWWTTLFCIDSAHPPEIMPGYRKADQFNIRYVFSRIRNSGSVLHFFFYVSYIFVFAPAYLYRWVIKSTVLFYGAMIYVVSNYHLGQNIQLILQLLWKNPKEWIARLYALWICWGVFDNVEERVGMYVDNFLVSKMLYLIYIPFDSMGWYQIISFMVLLITVFLLWFPLDFHILAKNLERSAIAWRANVIVTLMSIRTLLSALMVTLLVIQGIVLVSPLSQSIEKYPAVKKVVRLMYGRDLPVIPTRSSTMR